MSDTPPRGKIKILKDGPYHVTGGVPVSEDRIIIGADGEPERWEKGESLTVGESCVLCRCGGSAKKPFCDGAHVACAYKSGR